MSGPPKVGKQFYAQVSRSPNQSPVLNQGRRNASSQIMVHAAKTALYRILVVVLATGFAVQVVDVLIKYKEMQTTKTSKLARNDRLDFPGITLCPGFKSVYDGGPPRRELLHYPFFSLSQPGNIIRFRCRFTKVSKFLPFRQIVPGSLERDHDLHGRVHRQPERHHRRHHR